MLSSSRTGRAALGLSACLAAAVTSVPGQRDFSDVKILTHHVAGGIYMLEGSGGNIGVSAGEDGILIVDDQFAPLADRIKAALSDLDKGSLAFILNTHYHGDHVGGNEAFGADAPIIAHESVRRRLLEPGADKEPYPKVALPVITFDESLSVHFNGEEIQVIHFPHGHTDGDSIIFFTKSNVVHMGDHLFGNRFPFVDLDAGGTVQGYTKNIKDVIERIPADAKIIPGHGPLCTVKDLRDTVAMLEETTAIVKAGMDAGKGLEEMKKEGLPEKWDSWNWRFISTELWIETVHKSLSR